jgi:exopolysaccharide production protein ExoQ
LRPSIVSSLSRSEVFERLLIVFFFLMLMNVHAFFLFGPSDEVLGTDSEVLRSMRYSWIIFYLPLMFLILPRARRVLVSISSDVWLAILFVMCVVSTAWSIAAEDTLRRSFALFMTAGLGYYVAALFPPLSQLRMLAVSLTLAVVFGLAVGFLMPEAGVMSVLHPGAWRGVFVNKNQFGAVAALSFVTLQLLWILDGAPRVWLVPALIASLTALLLSNSLTALVTAMGVALVLGLVVTVRRGSLGSTLVLASSCAAGGVLLLSSLDTVLAWSGRDPTLTGRTLIWSEAWALIEERPVLGHGYGAFWVESGEPASLLQAAVQWATPTAHSGYLDLLLQLGVVGLILFLLSACTTLFRILALVRSGDRELVLSCCAAISFVLIYNVVESDLLVQNRLLSFLYVWAAAAARNREVGVSRAPRVEALSS